MQFTYRRNQQCNKKWRVQGQNIAKTFQGVPKYNVCEKKYDARQ